MRSILPQILFLCGLVLVGILIFASLAKAKTAPPDQSKINARCTAEWPTDYRMQKYCRKKQTAGRSDVGRWMKRHAVTSVNEKTPWGQMFRLCASEWTDQFGPNWRMVAYCLKKQETAYRSL